MLKQRCRGILSLHVVASHHISEGGRVQEDKEILTSNSLPGKSVWKLNQAAEFSLFFFLKKETDFLSNRVPYQYFFLFMFLKDSIQA